MAEENREVKMAAVRHCSIKSEGSGKAWEKPTQQTRSLGYCCNASLCAFPFTFFCLCLVTVACKSCGLPQIVSTARLWFRIITAHPFLKRLLEWECRCFVVYWLCGVHIRTPLRLSLTGLISLTLAFPVNTQHIAKNTVIHVGLVPLWTCPRYHTLYV